MIDYSEALDTNDDLVERLRRGDIWALPSLLEAVLGVHVRSVSILEQEE